MKCLGTRANLILIIAKADTLTHSDLFTFKQRVRPYLLRAERAILGYRAEPPDKHEQIVRAISNRRNDMNELQLVHFFISLSITLYRHCLSFVTHN
jgi:septin family protein